MAMPELHPRLISPSERELLAFHPDLLNDLVTKYLQGVGRLEKNQTAIVENVVPGDRVTIIDLKVETQMGQKETHGID